MVVTQGLALSDEERDKLGVRGLLPAGQISLVGTSSVEWNGAVDWCH